ncbi:MAG TPA: AGE family epimerase/isomerase [Vicinamibacterales bacterium]|nr:AGE family epimerase/isomerase [Vicinamibacterales bacterium]
MTLAAIALAPAGARTQGAPEQRLTGTIAALEKNLRENVIPFWFPRAVDREHGGYTIHFGPAGQPLPGGTKAIVTQARTLWLASRLIRSEFAQPGLREAADAGFRFLRDRLWDREHGGFFWEVDATGSKPLRANKHLYGQAFGLYSLAEYYLASGNPEALTLANSLFELLESRAHDGVYGGYREYFARDWSPPPAGENGYLGAPADLKLMNTHLHLMEALTTYVRAGAPLRARERLAELVAIESQAVMRRGWTASSDRHRRDWMPVLDEAASRSSYGHDLENIWLLVDALRALGQPTAPYHDLFRAVFDYAVRHGYDANAGGFFDSGPPQQPADRRAKIWWVQAEALVSAVTMFELTRDPQYADVFVRTWEFVNTKQTDWTSGEWHEAIEPDGRPRGGNKAHVWKAGYHNGRALIECVERIRVLSRGGG